MEKFSQFRDPGTGIQPFLKPIPPSGSEALALVVLPFGYVAGAIRSLLLIALGLLYVLLVRGVCLILVPVPPIHRAATYVFTAVVCRVALLLLGLWWIPVEMVTRKRGRGTKVAEKWNPGAGDLIVSNWASSIEILWLAFRFNPTFVLPVCSAADLRLTSSQSSVPISRKPGRRTGTGSAAISSSTARTPTPRVPIQGFRQVSLLSMLRATGEIPLAVQPGSEEELLSLEQIRSSADRPVVVFPECTTSNGRGLLRFAELFPDVSVPVTKFKVFVMCVRYDPPTALSPTLTQSIPSSTLNPFPHLFSLTTSLAPLTLSIRLLSPAESPSYGAFMPSEFISAENKDLLSESCAALITQTGRMKRLGMGWEDKVAFLEFYKGRK
ncbi:hypothetical protein B0H21DRAFT_878319 [Amylocystis lapponica]|nr:hypothetical protein B0H21DRAFT_878319 [Amylocystis lapponica]